MMVNQAVKQPLPIHTKVLRLQWLTQASQWGADQQVCLSLFDRLIKSYEGENRHYHNLSHVQHMLDITAGIQEYIEDPKAFYFATWFHDAVQIQGKDSELLSAQLAKSELTKIMAPQALIEKTYEFILATKNHRTNGKQDLALFLDVVLSILAAPAQAYQCYALNCRKEYSVPDFIYKLARKKFLKSLLKRGNIFNSILFQSTHEKIAINNIHWELKYLRSLNVLG